MPKKENFHFRKKGTKDEKEKLVDEVLTITATKESEVIKLISFFKLIICCFK